MTIPYEEPLTPRSPAPCTLAEPPRRGEPGGAPCGVCTGQSTAAVWSDEHWTLHPPVGGSLPGAVWVAHFHVWFLPRPLGMVEASGAMLPLWEDVLPNVPDGELRAAAERVAAAMG